MSRSDVGIAALYTAQADVAVLGRQITADEEKAFEWVFRYKPTRIELMTGSVDRAGRSPALVVLVHRDNPLRRISIQQLAALFGHRPDGATRSGTGISWGWTGHGKISRSAFTQRSLKAAADAISAKSCWRMRTR